MHTNKEHGDNRPSFQVTPVGTEVFMFFKGKEIRGMITMRDAGDWIYVSWYDDHRPPHAHIRDTQVYTKEKEAC